MSWDPTPTQRRLLFAGVVVVLAAIGAYLIVPVLARGPRDAPPDGSSRPSLAVGTGNPMPSVAPSPAPSGGGKDGGSLMDRLPVSEEELGRAADVAERFASAYTTYRYDEDPQAYEKRLAGLATDPIAQDLSGGSGAPAGRKTIERDRVVARGEAHVDGIRVLSEDSVVFVVSSEQKITSTRGATSGTKRFAITVVRADGGWRVSSLEDAAAGDRGDET